MSKNETVYYPIDGGMELRFYFNPKGCARAGVFQFGITGKRGYVKGYFWPFGIQVSLGKIKFEWRTKRLVELHAHSFNEKPKWYGIFSKPGIRA